ncbi:MAG: hypothetical protein L0L69_06220 [Propionibacterium sp.]|nr:hypothetical protein [Propionibacterium sp.]
MRKHPLSFWSCVTAALVATSALSISSPPASWAARPFNPGNIISDAEFYDSGALSDSGIQSFLASKEKECAGGAGVDQATCLKNYRTRTVEKASQAGLCSGYLGGQTQTAAQIIGGVARSCGISPKVLLVLLEKEQGLVTANYPAEWRFRSATGMGCPDTAACDSQYYGFFNQVYGAARQYKLYRLHPSWYAHQVGPGNKIAYSPSSGCGYQVVTIENQATAGLYNYTPYVPNAASLAAGYGSSTDRCASYGNRNFSFLYTDWFGSTGSDVPSAASAAITAKWQSLGGARGSLGSATESPRSEGAGVRQSFQGGTIYWTQAAGAHPVWGGIYWNWQARGGQTGSMGYPTTDEIKSGNGVYQKFQGGTIYWTQATGAYVR